MPGSFFRNDLAAQPPIGVIHRRRNPPGFRRRSSAAWSARFRLVLPAALINCGVAWVCSLWVSPQGTSHGFAGRKARSKWVRLHPTDGEHEVYMGRELVGFGCRILKLNVARLENERVNHFEGLVSRLEAGWPMLCFEGLLRIQAEPHVADDEAIFRIPAPARSALRIHGEGILPLRPKVSAFAINTLFYASSFWLLVRGPLALRRLIRRKRGICPACAYDLCHADHEACPECGAACRLPPREEKRQPARPEASSFLRAESSMTNVGRAIAPYVTQAMHGNSRAIMNQTTEVLRRRASAEYLHHTGGYRNGKQERQVVTEQGPTELFQTDPENALSRMCFSLSSTLLEKRSWPRKTLQRKRLQRSTLLRLLAIAG